MDRNVADLLRELPDLGKTDTASILSDLADTPNSEYISNVMRIYQSAQDVYGPAEAAYRAAIDAMTEAARTTGPVDQRGA